MKILVRLVGQHETMRMTPLNRSHRRSLLHSNESIDNMLGKIPTSSMTKDDAKYPRRSRKSANHPNVKWTAHYTGTTVDHTEWLLYRL